MRGGGRRVNSSNSCLDTAWASSSAVARQLALRECRLRTGRIQLRLRALNLGLERTRVDGEHRLALLHQGAVDEVDLVDGAADARPKLDEVGGFQAAAEFLAVGDAALHGRRDADRRRIRRAGLGVGGMPQPARKTRVKKPTARPARTNADMTTPRSDALQWHAWSFSGSQILSTLHVARARPHPRGTLTSAIRLGRFGPRSAPLRPKKKRPSRRGPSCLLVARAGFEPATFGL